MGLRVDHLQFGARQIVRAGLAGVTLAFLCGLFSSTQVGCEGAFYCGAKAFTCDNIPGQSACENNSACEWRVGCASGCRRAQTVQECAQHLACATSAATVCSGFGCVESDGGGPILTETECAAKSDCNWEPSCWDKAGTECNSGLDETECKRRNCAWLQGSNQL
jgi:hypothetical protein